MRMICRLLAVVLVAVCGSLLFAPRPAEAATHSVTISHYAFGPGSMTITAGDTVTWTNEDQAPHDVTTTTAPVAIHGSTMQQGQSWSFTFTTPGTYSYICSIHPDMKATLTVVPAHSGTPTHSATTAVLQTVPQARVRTVQRSASTEPAHSTPRATPTSTTASASPTVVAAQQTGATNSERPLRPLLIVAGIVAAVATLSLLMLASRPEDTG
jgi:plastocyanin